MVDVISFLYSNLSSIISGALIALFVHLIIMMKNLITRKIQIKAIRNFFKDKENKLKNTKGIIDHKFPVNIIRFNFYKAFIHDAKDIIIYRYSTLSNEQTYELIFLLNQENRFIQDVLKNEIAADETPYDQFFAKLGKIKWLKYN